MTCTKVTETTLRDVALACARLPAPQGDYLEEDALRVCILAVIDFQQTEKAVLRATKRFEEVAVPTFRLGTLEDLTSFLADHPDNREVAQLLWGYNLHTRAAMLRSLASYFLTYKR